MNIHNGLVKGVFHKHATTLPGEKDIGLSCEHQHNIMDGKNDQNFKL